MSVDAIGLTQSLHLETIFIFASLLSGESTEYRPLSPPQFSVSQIDWSELFDDGVSLATVSCSLCRDWCRGDGGTEEEGGSGGNFESLGILHGTTISATETAFTAAAKDFRRTLVALWVN
mmetsp:Transcript_33740/g.79557  ORF Transcript_33740/g.79557 Transcript_33740/m.79557 type:complete len:120 (+) Transcript_33740:549-908(+)